MLARQTLLYLLANAGAAAFGLMNASLFTRIFDSAELGHYFLGLAFANVYCALLTSWLRLLIMRDQSRQDGTDMRGLVLAGIGGIVVAAPLGYPMARLMGLTPETAAAAVGLAAATGLLETSLDVLRAGLRAGSVLKGTLLRAGLVCVFGITCGLLGASGVQLLLTTTLAYLVAVAAIWRNTWRGATPDLAWRKLLGLARDGLPLTISIFVLVLSSFVDRFLIAGLSGVAPAGNYSAGVDLVRQALIIPAISAASAFVPMTVQILTHRGMEATQTHLRRCLELLLAVTLPASLGFALVSPEIAQVVLGPDYRETATQVMPIVAISVIFQIVTQQYLHIAFMLSKRNSFYLVNTGSVLLFNLLLAPLAILALGPAGAAWARLATEMFGTLSAFLLARRAFPLPLLRVPGAVRPIIAALAMTLAVMAIRHVAPTSPQLGLAMSILGGAVVYVACGFALNMLETRDIVLRHLNRLVMPRRATISAP